MPNPTSFILFVIAALALLLTPGPAVLYIITRSVDQGRRAGLVSTVGVGVGTMFHVVGAALGLSALLLSSVLAFSLVKYLGAAYLIWLGVRKLLTKETLHQPAVHDQEGLGHIFRQGVVVNLLNPKTALFIFAFLPQFISLENGSVAGQFLFLGFTLVGLGIFSDSLYALLAGTAGNWLRGHPGFFKLQRYFSGGMYITLGIAAAMSGAGKK